MPNQAPSKTVEDSLGTRPLSSLRVWTYRREWQGIVNGLLGLWLIFSAFVPGLMVSGNLWICGIIVMVLATWRIISVQREHPAAG